MPKAQGYLPSPDTPISQDFPTWIEPNQSTLEMSWENWKLIMISYGLIMI